MFDSKEWLELEYNGKMETLKEKEFEPISNDYLVLLSVDFPKKWTESRCLIQV